MGNSSIKLPFLLAIIISAIVYSAFTDHRLFEQKSNVIQQSDKAVLTIHKKAQTELLNLLKGIDL